MRTMQIDTPYTNEQNCSFFYFIQLSCNNWSSVKMVTFPDFKSDIETLIWFRPVETTSSMAEQARTVAFTAVDVGDS